MATIVSYVGLSDNEHDANGYNEVHAFADKYDAIVKMRTLRNNEIDNLDEGDYEILVDTTTEFRMAWCGYAEQIRIYLHEVEI